MRSKRSLKQARKRGSSARMDASTRTAAEAYAFRKLVAHLAENSDVQNIDLMGTADFCRNCLAKWLREGVESEGGAIDYEQARELVYGEPYEQWRGKHAPPASPEQLAALQRMKERKDARATDPNLTAHALVGISSLHR